MYIDITPETLIEETYNYYGIKAELEAAIEFLSHQVHATPSSFMEWICRKK